MLVFVELMRSIMLITNELQLQFSNGVHWKYKKNIYSLSNSYILMDILGLLVVGKQNLYDILSKTIR